MTFFGCNCKCSCNLAAIAASVLIGVITAFLQFAGVVTATPAFLWVVLGIAVVYLGVLLLSMALTKRPDATCCGCSSLGTVLLGILGSILFSVVLLAIGVVATSILSAVLVGILLLFLALTITGTACLIRALADCGC